MADQSVVMPQPDLRVRSTDGTPIGVFVQGQGPPLVLVHGSMQDHTASAPFVDELSTRLTCYSMDRRGFGVSGDADGYSIEREFDDVAAVVERVAATTGDPVALWGHSFGASCAMGGAARSTDNSHLVLYEPSLGLQYPPGVIETVEAALAAGDHEAAIVVVLRELLELSQAEIAAMRSTPEWSRRVAVAPTIPRECRVEQGWRFEPGQFDTIAAPTLLLSGSDSSAEIRHATHAAATAIPHARIHSLDGHGHIAHRTHPARVAAIVAGFVEAGSGSRR